MYLYGERTPVNWFAAEDHIYLFELRIVIEQSKYNNDGNNIADDTGHRSERKISLTRHKNITRNSSGDEIANVNFLYDDIVHVLQNTIDSRINSATDRRGYVLERMCLPNSVK